MRTGAADEARQCILQGKPEERGRRQKQQQPQQQQPTQLQPATHRAVVAEAMAKVAEAMPGPTEVEREMCQSLRFQKSPRSL